MSALSEAPIAHCDVKRSAKKPHPKRTVVALADAIIIPEAR